MTISRPSLRKIKKCEIYLLLFFIYSFVYELNESLLNLNWLMNITNIVTIGVLICMLLFNRYTFKKMLIQILIIVLFFLAALLTTRIRILILALFIANAYYTDFHRIAKTSALASVFAVFVVFVLAKLEFIPNLTYYHNGIKVYCYGFSYYTTVPFILIYTFLIYLYLRKELSWLEIVMWLGVNVLLYRTFTVSLVFVVGISILVMYIFWVKWSLFSMKSKVLEQLVKIAFPLVTFLTFLVAKLYTADNPVMLAVNLALSGRLSLGKRALEMYDIHLLGQYIATTGHTVNTNAAYFYIDSGYLYSLLGYGLLLTILVIVMYSYIYTYAYRYKEKTLFIWVTACLIFCVVNNALLSFAYNPLLLAMPYIFDIKRLKRNRMR